MSQADSAHTIDLPAATNAATEKLPRQRKSTGKTPAARPEAATAAIDAVLTMIQRAANAGEIGTLERLLAWRDKQIADAKETAFKESLSAAMSRMTSIRVDSENSQTHSRYASLAAMDDAVRAIYTDHGFSLTFDTQDTNLSDVVRLVCDMSHEGGHTRQYHINMPADGMGPKGAAVMTRTHATGSAITYGRRYLLQMIFNLTVARDDDGNAAGRRPQPQQHVQRPAPEAQQLTPRFEDLMAQEFPSPHSQGYQSRRGPLSFDVLAADARAAARKGSEAANTFCLSLTKPQYDTLQPIMSELRALVAEADKAKTAKHRQPQDDGLDIPANLRRQRQ